MGLSVRLINMASLAPLITKKIFKAYKQRLYDYLTSYCFV